MKVFVAGGTGAIGRHLVPRLIQDGHAVTAPARTPEKAAALTAQGAEAVRVSLFDRRELAVVLAGHDAAVNVATAIPPTKRFLSAKAWAANDRVCTEGSAAIVDAALAAGVGRVVQESVGTLYRDQGANWIDEESPVDDFPMARGNFAAEANARRFGEEGDRTSVVLRFGWFYGPGAAHSEEMPAQARHHIGLVLGPPEAYVSSIHMADAAAAAAAALTVPAGTCNVVDDEPLTKRDYARALERAAGTAMWLRGPGRAARIFGDRLTSLTRSVRVSNRRFREATGWAPRHPSAREGRLATAEGLRR